MSFFPNIIQKPLRTLSYYNTGGDSLGIIAPQSVDEVRLSLDWIKAQNKPYFVLGGGTNSLVSDYPWDGFVISFHLMDRMEVNGNTIRAEAGVINTDIAKKALQANLGGLAWMYRLPGQLGGTVRMNARCYGGEISQVCSAVTVVTKDGKIKTYDSTEKIFRGYKDTLFMENGDLICEIMLELEEVNYQQLKDVEAKMMFCERDRISKGQFIYPTCGCIFKNNHDPSVSVSSGMLLEQSGLKGKKVGGAEVAKGHANFVYNKSGNSSDILELSFLMREMVYEKFGIWLDYEMEILGTLTDNQNQYVQLKKDMTSDPDKLARLREVRKLFNKKHS